VLQSGRITLCAIAEGGAVVHLDSSVICDTGSTVNLGGPVAQEHVYPDNGPAAASAAPLAAGCRQLVGVKVLSARPEGAMLQGLSKRPDGAVVVGWHFQLRAEKWK